MEWKMSLPHQRLPYNHSEIIDREGGVFMTNRHTLLERLAEDVNAPELRNPLRWKWVTPRLAQLIFR